MITRRIGKIVFGSATPTQIMLACTIAGMLGFMPGFTQAAGLIALFTVLIVLLNLPLPLAGLVGALAKLLSLALMPVSFAVGRALLDGPTQPIFQWLINAPVLAWFGLEFYATTGGLVLGLLFGVVAGLLVVRCVRVIRHRMANLEQNSEKFQQWAGKKWVRLLMFVLFGGLPKQGFAALLEQKRGKMVRPLGLAIAGGIVVVGVLVQMILAEPLVTHNVRTALERANGATVDLERVDLDLRSGRVTLHELAMADPNELETDLLRAAEVTAEISAADLLRKRITLDEVLLTEARHGEPRAVPGRRVGPRPSPPDVETREGEQTLEDFIADAEQIQQRLQQIQEWLDRVSGADTDPEPDEVDPDVVDPDTRPSLPERIEERVAEHGYANVQATHLITGRPTLTVIALRADRLRSRALEDELIDVHAEHLSTHPHLHDHPPRINVTSSADSLRLDLHMAGLAAGANDQPSTVAFFMRNIGVDGVAHRLAGDGAPVSGGTVELSSEGTLATAGGVALNMPLHITLRDTVAQVGGQSAEVDQLTFPLGLRGPIASPRLTLDQSQLTQAMVDAGASAVTERAREEAEGVLDRAGDELRQLGAGLFGGGDDDADDEPE